MILVVSNLLRELLPLIVYQNLSIFSAMGIAAVMIPFTLPYIVPWSLLVSVQLTFGRLSADNELSAMSASGVSTTRVCLPVFLVAVSLSLLCLWINCIWAPRAEVEMLDSLMHLALENPAFLFQENQRNDIFLARRVYVESVEGNHLKNLQIFEFSGEGNLQRIVSAKEAVLSRSEKSGAFELNFKNTRIEERPPSAPEGPLKVRQGIYLNEGSYVLPVGRAAEAISRKNGLSAQTMSQLHIETTDTTNPRQSRARLEIHRRLSQAMACITFVLVGIPLAVTAHRRETSAGFAISLILAFYYYFFIIVAQAFASSPLLSIALVWTPNVVFVIAGLVLFRRLSTR